MYFQMDWRDSSSFRANLPMHPAGSIDPGSLRPATSLLVRSPGSPPSRTGIVLRTQGHFHLPVVFPGDLQMASPIRAPVHHRTDHYTASRRLPCLPSSPPAQPCRFLTLAAHIVLRLPVATTIHWLHGKGCEICHLPPLLACTSDIRSAPKPRIALTHTTPTSHRNQHSRVSLQLRGLIFLVALMYLHSPRWRPLSSSLPWLQACCR